MFDLVIRDVLLLDGLGSAPVRGDLAVTGDRIAAVGKVEGASKTTLDAGGLALMPGSSTTTPTTTPRSPGTRAWRPRPSSA
jgi:N-acyl-D-aspartate/D-glutamate deacylase